MTQREKRESMEKAIKEYVIPFLREQGFKGSFPNFRRERNINLNLITFQFSRGEESKFVVEIGNCSSVGIETSWGDVLLHG